MSDLACSVASISAQLMSSVQTLRCASVGECSLRMTAGGRASLTRKKGLEIMSAVNAEAQMRTEALRESIAGGGGRVLCGDSECGVFAAGSFLGQALDRTAGWRRRLLASVLASRLPLCQLEERRVSRGAVPRRGLVRGDIQARRRTSHLEGQSRELRPGGQSLRRSFNRAREGGTTDCLLGLGRQGF